MPFDSYYRPTKDTLHLDYETACELDLRKVGLDRYSAAPSCRVLMAAYRINDGPLRHWEGHRAPFPSDLREALVDPEVERWAFNAQFERVITRRVLKIPTPIRNWRCTMVLAFMQSFTGGLGEIGKQVGLPLESRKFKTGDDLIRVFSVPQKPTTNQPHVWRNWDTDPDLWEEFVRYNQQDVLTEEAVKRRLIGYPVPEDEWQFYELDQMINDRGVPLDKQFVSNVMWMAARRKAELAAEMREITGLSNPLSVAQLLPWVRGQGYPYPNLQKEFVAKALARHRHEGGLLTDECVRILECRLLVSKTSISKADAADRTVGPGDRVRFMYQFAGASRTGRFAGRNVQPQNMVRTPKMFDPEDGDERLTLATNLIRQGDYDGFELFVNEPMDAFSGAMRSMFRAPEGHQFTVCDYSSVESAGLGWVAKCPRLLDVFRSGKDPYKDFATLFFEKPYDEVTRAERNICKPPTLGCFSADTLVFIARGWVPISCIRKADLVFDGVDFVSHDGVVDQGVKAVIDFNGVSVTPDHEILCGDDWCPVLDVSRNTRLEKQAIASANGMFSRTFGWSEEHCITAAGVRDVEKLKSFTRKIWSGVRLKVASIAPMNVFAEQRMVFMNVLKFLAKPSIVSRTGIMRFAPGAEVWGWAHIGMRGVVSVASSSMSTSSSVIASRCPVQTVRSFGSTVSTITETMRSVISGLLNLCRVAETKKSSVGLNTKVNGCALLSFGSGMRRFIKINRRSPAKLGRGCHRNGSLPIRPAAEVRTYDILNCGPRNRFMVWTNAGPVIAHNCGYRLSAGRINEGSKTGLLRYAEGMGIDMSEEQAERAVSVFRSGYPEIPQFWYGCEDAIRYTMQTQRPYDFGYLQFDYRKPYLTIRLPSGRLIYYYRPQYVKRSIKIEWEKTSVGWSKVDEPYYIERVVFGYMGRKQGTTKWEVIPSHGGVCTENIVQSLTRDILKVGLQRLHEAGFKIVGHSHDEAIAVTPIGDNYYTLERMRELMSAPIAWAPGFPLNAAGWSAPFYRK